MSIFSCLILEILSPLASIPFSTSSSPRILVIEKFENCDLEKMGDIQSRTRLSVNWDINKLWTFQQPLTITQTLQPGWFDDPGTKP